jgi:type VI protein secretion system component VasF
MSKRLLAVVVSIFVLGVPMLALQPPSSSQDGFVPANELPPGQQLPAAPLLIGAYAFFLALMLFYLWTIWRRIGKVEEEMRALERRAHGRGR